MLNHGYWTTKETTLTTCSTVAPGESDQDALTLAASFFGAVDFPQERAAPGTPAGTGESR